MILRDTVETGQNKSRGEGLEKAGYFEGKTISLKP